MTCILRKDFSGEDSNLPLEVTQFTSLTPQRLRCPPTLSAGVPAWALVGGASSEAQLEFQQDSPLGQCKYHRDQSNQCSSKVEQKWAASLTTLQRRVVAQEPRFLTSFT